MADNVIYLDIENTLDIPVERVLEGALHADLEFALVAGRHPDGRFYLACSSCEIPTVIVLLELAKARLLRRIDET